MVSFGNSSMAWGLIFSKKTNKSTTSSSLKLFIILITSFLNSKIFFSCSKSYSISRLLEFKLVSLSSWIFKYKIFLLSFSFSFCNCKILGSLFSFSSFKSFEYLLYYNIICILLLFSFPSSSSSSEICSSIVINFSSLIKFL